MIAEESTGRDGSAPEDWLLNSSDVGLANRSRVLKLLYRTGPLTRAELATRLAVSRAPVSAVVQPLIKIGMLVEQDARASGEKGGKPARPLWFGTELRAGAIYLSPDECTAAVVGLDGRIHTSLRMDTSHIDEDRLPETIFAMVTSVLRSEKLLGVCIAYAGTVDWPTGELIANYRRPGTSRIPLASLLREDLGVPVFATHHPRVQAYGDAWMGPGRTLASFGSVFTGEVLGIGIFQDHEVRQGTRGAGGEAGHMVVDMNGDPCACGRRGCWETVATLGWLRERAGEAGLPDPETVTSDRLMCGSEQDHRREDLAKRYANMIGLGLANIEQILGLGTYILHGDVARGGEQLRRWTEDALVTNSPKRDPAPRIILSTDPDHSVIRGCVALVITHVFPSTPRKGGRPVNGSS